MKLKNNYFAKHPLVAVFLFTFICLLPEMLMRDFTPSNELRYLSIADEALRDGHFFAFFNHGLAYADKPPLYIWLVMLCKVLFGSHSSLALSMLSVVPAFVIVWLMDRWVMSNAKATDRMAMAVLLLTSIMFLGTMAVIRMDMLMCMFIVMAMFTFLRMYELDSDGLEDPRNAAVYKKCSWLLPVWIFMALFTKGPVGLLVPPLSIIVFLAVKRKWRDIGKYLGWKTWSVIAGLCIVWFSCVYIDGGKSYLDNLLFKQTMGRAVNAFTHSRPFWFYAVAILWCIAPYTFLLLGALGISICPRRHKNVEIPAREVKSDKEVLFLSVIFTTFLMLSMFSSKLPVYLVPIFPFLAYLFPLVISRKGARLWVGWAIGIPAAILMLAGLACLLVLSGIVNADVIHSLTGEYPFIFSAPVKIAAVLCFVGNAIAIWFLIRNKQWNLPVFMVGSSLLLTIYAASGVLSSANAYMGYREICREVPTGTEVVTLFLHRPENIDVYVGRETTNLGKDLDAFLNMAADSTKALTLITKESELDKHPELREFVYSSGTAAFSGPYCTVTRIPGHRPVRNEVAPEGVKIDE